MKADYANYFTEEKKSIGMDGDGRCWVGGFGKMKGLKCT